MQEVEKEGQKAVTGKGDNDRLNRENCTNSNIGTGRETPKPQSSVTETSDTAIDSSQITPRNVRFDTI
jgi:hypothetical protein